MKNHQTVRSILIAHVFYMIKSYLNFDFNRRDKSSLQHLLYDLTPWVNGMKNLTHYLEILNSDQPKTSDYAKLKNSMLETIGIYLGDTNTIIGVLKPSYPDVNNNSIMIAEAEYRIKRILCGYQSNNDLAGKSLYNFFTPLTEGETKTLITKLDQEDQIYKTSKLNKGLINIIKEKLTGPHKIAKNVILDEVLEECEEISQKYLRDLLDAKQEKQTIAVYKKLKQELEESVMEKPKPLNWTERAKKSLSKIYRRK